MRAPAFSAFLIAATALAACHAASPENVSSEPQYVAPDPPAAPVAEAVPPPAIPDANDAPARASGPPRSLLVPPP